MPNSPDMIERVARAIDPSIWTFRDLGIAFDGYQESQLNASIHAAGRVVEALSALNAANVEGLVTALEQWKCPSCGGSRVYTQRWRTNEGSGSEDVPCKVCEQTGLHPIARTALNEWRKG